MKQIHRDGKLHQGDELIVQVEREEGKNKPATVVTDISLTGVYLVLFHGAKDLRFSVKITDADWKKKMRSTVSEWMDGSFGLMLRTNAYHAEESDIFREFTVLKERYERIVREGLTRVAGTRLLSGLPAYLCDLRDEKTSVPDRILVQDPEIAAEVEAFAESFRPDFRDRLVVRDSSDYPISAEFDMKKRLSELVAKKVWLRSGAYLVIEPTEAMTVIDVNTGKASEGKSVRDGFLNTLIFIMLVISLLIQYIHLVCEDFGYLVFLSFAVCVFLAVHSSQDVQFRPFLDCPYVWLAAAFPYGDIVPRRVCGEGESGEHRLLYFRERHASYDAGQFHLGQLFHYHSFFHFLHSIRFAFIATRSSTCWWYSVALLYLP